MEEDSNEEDNSLSSIEREQDNEGFEDSQDEHKEYDGIIS
jgi:hypothetical protein